MEAVVLTMRSEKTSPLHQIARELDRQLYEAGAELVANISKEAPGMQMMLLSYEKFYWRNSSYASLQVLLNKTETEQEVTLIGSGGGAGILNISWGANQNFAKCAEKTLKQMGFVLKD